MSKTYNSGIKGFIIRPAAESDCCRILSFIRELAAYEKLENLVVATTESLRDTIFVKKQAKVIIGEYNGIPAGFALYFYNYSTFLGKAGLYLEDLFIKEDFRGRGFGTAMLACLASIAVSENCERMDWWCLDWNKASIDFYLKLGAKPMDEWTTYRLDFENLKKVADDFDRRSNGLS